jgi:hypothetical protein
VRRRTFGRRGTALRRSLERWDDHLRDGQREFEPKKKRCSSWIKDLIIRRNKNLGLIYKKN